MSSILVLSSLGGNGHESARHVLQEALGSKYKFEVYYPIQDHLVSRGFADIGTCYNEMVKKGFNRTINFISKVTPFLLNAFPGKKIIKTLEKRITDTVPVCVISLCPLINRIALEACAKLNVPFCLVTLDPDLTTWFLGLKNEEHLSKNTVITIGSDVSNAKKIIEERGLSPKKLITTGFPVRKEFLKITKTKEELMEKLQIRAEKVITLIWGGMGSSHMLPIIKKLGQTPLEAEFIVITGRNTSLAEQMKTIPLHEKNFIQVLGFVGNVSEYMQVSNIVITKPGPGTTSEAFAIGKEKQRRGESVPYLLLQGDTDCIIWEKPNVTNVIEAGIGKEFTSLDDLTSKVKSLLEKPVPVPDLPQNIFSECISEIVTDFAKDPVNQERIRHAHSLKLDSCFSFEEPNNPPIISLEKPRTSYCQRVSEEISLLTRTCIKKLFTNRLPLWETPFINS